MDPLDETSSFAPLEPSASASTIRMFPGETAETPSFRSDDGIRLSATPPATPGPARAPSGPPPIEARYEIRDELGRGGMGVVYRALDRDLQREVALKVMLGVDGSALPRFVAEARATAQLQHPGVVPIYDIGLDSGKNLFFTMKLIEGETLEHVIRRTRANAPDVGEFTLFRLLQIFVEVARTVAYAHERGIVHRDLKPANVMIGRHGEVQLLDWGLAKVLRQAAPEPAPADAAATAGTLGVAARGETVGGAVTGTPAYLSPEQARGNSAKVGPPADVWALGGTLSQILTGRAPFHEGTCTEVVAKLLDGEGPPRPREVDRAVPRELDAICAKAMAVDPARRYASALALAEDVQAFLEHRPVTAYPEGRLPRATKWLRRHRRSVGAAAAVLLALGLGIAESARREREVFLAGARAEARRASAAFAREWGSAAALHAARVSDEERRRRLDRALGLGLAALQATGREVNLEPARPEARAWAFDAALALGEAAIEAEQWGLAKSALERARDLDVDPSRAEQALAEVERARSRVADEHRRAVEAVIAGARSGELATHRDAEGDALFALVRYPEAQTVAILGAALDGVTAELRAAAREALLAGAAPGDAEAIALAVDRTLAFGPEEELSAGDAALFAGAARRLEERELAAVTAGARPRARGVQRLVAAAQERRLGPNQVLLARLACEALDRIGAAEGAVEPLGRYLQAEYDHDRAIPAGVALCHLGTERALRFALARQRRFGTEGALLREIFRLKSPALEAELPPTEAGFFDRALLRYGAGDHEGAVAAISRAIELAPADPRALTMRSFFRRKAGDLEGAMADASRAIELDPHDIHAWNNRGHARRHNDYAGAIADYTRAIEIDRKEVSGWFDRGVARREQGDFAGAIVDLTRAIELDPLTPRGFRNRGLARAKLGEKEEALEDFEHAVEYGPLFAESWYLRGRAREALGDTEGAASDLARFLELAPEDKDAGRARELLARIRARR
jgi:serine/threonine protein kinase/tetratricopeptide (TPR) repeat protein